MQDLLLPWLIPAISGGAFALALWSLLQAWSTVPIDDRTYLDPPPVGFRLAWWLIHPIAVAIRPWLGARLRAATARTLQQAGLEFQISAEHFQASRVAAALAFGGFVAWVVDTLGVTAWGGFAIGGGAGLVYPSLWLADRVRARKRELQKSFPFYLDIVTLCVEAGLNFNGAIQQAVQKGPRGALQDELRRVVRDGRAGQPRADALRAMAERLRDDAVTSWVHTVIQAEQLGMSLGPVLRAQSDHKRTERFLRAEKLAMEAPVKMLLPLIACIFPCTAAVIAFPIVMKLLEIGL